MICKGKPYISNSEIIDYKIAVFLIRFSQNFKIIFKNHILRQFYRGKQKNKGIKKSPPLESFQQSLNCYKYRFPRR